MFIVGALFAAVWVLSFVLGKRLDSRLETSPEGGDPARPLAPVSH